jgi:glycosyltransferase involved in cell wall biosynthesis
MKVLALTRYGPLAASTRQRIVQYRPALADAGIALTVAPLLNDDYVRGLVGSAPRRPGPIAAAYWHRWQWLRRARTFDLLWVYDELFPYLPGALERAAGRSGKPVVVDWDDAFFHVYDAHSSAVVRRLLGGKLAPLLESAAAVTCGNAYLQRYASRYCERTLIVPTVVDTDRYGPDPALERRPAGPPVIGWIGSPSTWRNVRPLLPLLGALVSAGRARFRAVGAGRAAEAKGFPGLEFVEWSEDSEIAEVQAMDIGIMPLEDRPFEQGKCGYKLIQYMACALPVVASPVGVNRTIVTPDCNGLLATTTDEWAAALDRLIDDPALRRRWGERGRERVVREYSLASQAPRLVELFLSLRPPVAKAA